MAEEAAVIACHSVEEWSNQLQKANDCKKLAVIDFTASWCGPCKLIAPIFAELAKKYPNVIFLKVDIDELRSVAEEWQIEAMPTFLFLADGKMVDKIVGSRKEDLHAKVEQYASKSG